MMLAMLDKDTTDGLRQAARKVAEWTRERDSRIRQAAADGGGLREIARAVGLSHSGVKKIVER